MTVLDYCFVCLFRIWRT